MKKLNYEEMTGTEFIVELSNDLNKYALQLLKIFNNVRESRKLYQVRNNSKNNAFVVCNPKYEELVKEWLEEECECKVLDKSTVTVYSFDSYELWDEKNEREIIFTVE